MSGKQCVLTINHPNGASRSYHTDPIFSRKNEAKAQVATKAIEMGAIEFIVSGGAESAKGKKGLILAPLDAPGGLDVEMSDGDSPTCAQKDDASIKQIEETCLAWRAGRVRPQWMDLMEPKFENSLFNIIFYACTSLTPPNAEHGCALRIKLSRHSYRVYSSEASFDTVSEARKACAQGSLDQDVLNFIKFGNGQTHPAAPPAPHESGSPASEDTTPAGPLSLQAFYDALPQPFPEPFGEKSAVEINAPGRLNSLLQDARGGKLSVSFIWMMDYSQGCEQIFSLILSICCMTQAT